MFTNLDKFYYLSIYLVKKAKGKGGLLFVSGVDQRKESAWSLKSSVLYPEKTIIEREVGTPMFTAALFTIDRTWEQHRCHWQMNGYRTVVYIYHGILFSYKEHTWVGLNEVNESRAYCAQWSKSERERQILYFSVSVWNLERWHWWTYLHGSNGDADTENRLMEIAGE